MKNHSNNTTHSDTLNNVIRMPRSKTRRAEMIMTQDRQRFALAASLLSVVALVSLLNHNFLNQHAEITSPSERGIASVGSVSQSGYDKAWQDKLAHELTKSMQSDKALLAQKPNDLEQLRFGTLEGKYGFKFENGAVEEIALNPNTEVTTRIENLEKFLSEHKTLFGVNFKDTKAIEPGVFELISESGSLLATARFELDTKGQFIGLKIEKK